MTTVENTLILRDLFRYDFQSLLSLLHVLQVAAILHFTSASVLLVIDPRYLKSFAASSMVLSRITIWTGSVWLYTWHLVFLVLAFNPMLRDSILTLFGSSWACQISSDNNAMSSVKSRSVSTTLVIICSFHLLNDSCGDNSYIPLLVLPLGDKTPPPWR